MVKVAVWSGVKTGRVIPHCLYTGDTGNALYAWLVRQGVRMLHHEPTWADTIYNKATSALTTNKKHSHLYASRAGVVGTWQRIDIPLLNLPYEYALFADSDTIFMRRINLAEFGLPLPACLGMAWEMQDHAPYNAGVMLMRLPCLKDTYADFLAFILASPSGYFPNFGPVDQGAINQFYERQIVHIPKKWNAKPYHPVIADAAIVHFHGPKPSHLADFVRTGTCPFNFGDMCNMAMRAAAPTYLETYRAVLEEINAEESSLQPPVVKGKAVRG